MIAKFTPGPWQWHHDHGWLVVESDNGDLCIKIEKGTTSKKHTADARLIAAAPELLEAHEPDREGPNFLDWIADRMIHQHGEHAQADFILCLRRRAEKARTALAKATGDQS